MREYLTLGFIGLGVMGEPMCRHLAQKSGKRVLGFDISPAPLQRLADIAGVRPAASVAEVAREADILFVSLPSGRHLQAVCQEPGGVLAHACDGQIIVDLGTSPPTLTRELEAAFADKGVRYADAPVARTREAAERGELAITVGAAPEVFAVIEPLLRCFAAEVTLCGGVGAGQAVKILNNMVVVGTVLVLSEAAAIGRAFGLDTPHLFETFSKGSADSFALRNHGLKMIAAESFPKRVFSTEYMLKDIRYALEMAHDAGAPAEVADYGRRLLEAAAAKGWGDDYWPVISTLVKGAAPDSGE